MQKQKSKMKLFIITCVVRVSACAGVRTWRYLWTKSTTRPKETNLPGPSTWRKLTLCSKSNQSNLKCSFRTFHSATKHFLSFSSIAVDKSLFISVWLFLFIIVRWLLIGCFYVFVRTHFNKGFPHLVKLTQLWLSCLNCLGNGDTRTLGVVWR